MHQYYIPPDKKDKNDKNPLHQVAALIALAFWPTPAGSHTSWIHTDTLIINKSITPDAASCMIERLRIKPRDTGSYVQTQGAVVIWPLKLNLSN